MRPAPASQVSPMTESWNVRPAPATAKTSPWMIVCSVNLNFAWMGDHEHRGDALPRVARREVLFLREGVEGLLEAELDGRARDEQLEAEVLRRIERERAAVAVGRRQRVRRVEAAHARQLEAVPLEEVAALDALAPAARRVAVEAGQRVQRLASPGPSSSSSSPLVARRRRRVVGVVVVVVRRAPTGTGSTELCPPREPPRPSSRCRGPIRAGWRRRGRKSRVATPTSVAPSKRRWQAASCFFFS